MLKIDSKDIINYSIILLNIVVSKIALLKFVFIKESYKMCLSVHRNIKHHSCDTNKKSAYL